MTSCKLEVTKFLIKMHYFVQISGKALNCNTHYSFKLLLITVVWEWLYLKCVAQQKCNCGVLKLCHERLNFSLNFLYVFKKTYTRVAASTQCSLNFIGSQAESWQKFFFSIGCGCIICRCCSKKAWSLWICG